MVEFPDAGDRSPEEVKMSANDLFSVILVNYNGIQDLEGCLTSIQNQTYARTEIILVDNASTDGSVAFVKQNYPGVNLIALDKNLGYAYGNNVGVQHATGRYVVISNVDVEVDRFWLERLHQPFLDDPRIRMTTPKILLYHERNIINACGNFIQFTGHGGNRGFGKPSSEMTEREDVACPSGASFMIERSHWYEYGGFDVSLIGTNMNGAASQNYYMEVDMAWALLAQGFRVVCEPSSIVYHKYMPKCITPEKYYDLEVAHWSFVIKNFGPITLIASGPGLFFSELVAWGFAVHRGAKYIQQKFRAYRWIFTHLRTLRALRAQIQARKCVSEKHIFRYLTHSTSFTHHYEGKWTYQCIEQMLNSCYWVLYGFAKATLGLIGDKT